MAIDQPPGTDQTLPSIIKLDEALDPTAKLFGERFRELRNGLGLTQSQVSESTGITPAYISLVERGKANPTLDMMVKLSEAVGGKVWDLVRPPSEDRVE